MLKFLSRLLGITPENQTFKRLDHVFRFPNGIELPLSEGVANPLTESVTLEAMVDKHRKTRDFTGVTLQANGDDESVWCYSTSPYTWRIRGGRAGAVLVRDGVIVEQQMTVMS